MNHQVSTDTGSAITKFSAFMDKFKPQMALALPRHLTADRMARLALTQFSSNPKLQECDPTSIAGSIMTASTLGLEPGVNGQGYLVPYYDKRRRMSICNFIPGWKGLVDIANRSGRCTVWTGAVFEGDHFEYALGDRPFVQHRPGDEDRAEFLTHVYAVGRVNGSDWPVIEVWSVKKVMRHRDTFNKVGDSHYSFRDWEMYARKVPLLQVLKYMPSSIELSNALAASHAAETNRSVTIDGNFVTINEPFERDDDGYDDGATVAAPAPAPRSKSESAKAASTPAASAAPLAKEVTDAPPNGVRQTATQPKQAEDMFAGSAASEADQGTGELKAVTAGQVKFLNNKIASMDLPASAITAMLARIGAKSMENLTFAQYDTVRAELLALE